MIHQVDRIRIKRTRDEENLLVVCEHCVNDKDYKVYFPLAYLQNQVEAPFKAIEAADKFDVKVNAGGGGVKGQAEAVKLGIARALLEINPEYRPALKAAGVLKRDPRSVERKKFGHKKARKSFQFSKR